MSTDKRSIEWYNQNAENYAAHVRDADDSIYHSLYEKPAMYEQLPDLKNKDVISLGCGSGEDSHLLKTKGANLSLGIDISEKLIGKAREAYSECEFKVMDMEKLELPDESFDFAYSSLAIHYIEDWSTVFKEVFRILKPGSNFLFSCGHPVNSAMQLTIDTDIARAKQLGFITDKKTHTTEIIGDYLSRRKIDQIDDIMQVTTYHKPLSEIVSEAASAGFVVESLVEPKPLEKMKELSMNSYNRLSKIPFFVIFKLLKPDS